MPLFGPKIFIIAESARPRAREAEFYECVVKVYTREKASILYWFFTNTTRVSRLIDSPLCPIVLYFGFTAATIIIMNSFDGSNEATERKIAPLWLGQVYE